MSACVDGKKVIAACLEPTTIGAPYFEHIFNTDRSNNIVIATMCLRDHLHGF
jgi:hypothetical protein